jgi:hypothetical protein
MKKKLFLVAMAILSFAAHSQDCSNVDLETDTGLRQAQPCVAEAAAYLLSKPLSSDNKKSTDSRALIIGWMDKTSEYTFVLNPMMLEICLEKKNNNLLGIYLSCLAKSVIASDLNYKEDAINMFIDYVNDKKNEVKITSRIKKLIDAKKEDKLEAYF